jgi:hypothetical protein
MTKKENNNKIYFGLFIIFIMVSSSVGFMYGGDSNTKKIDDKKYTKTGAGWEVYIDQIESYWVFTYLPTEIDFEIDELNLNDNELNIYAEGYDKEYIDEFKFVLLYKGIVIHEVEELDCNSNTWVLESNTLNSEVIKENNCVYLKGNINKFIDGLTYKIFGVI